MTFYLDCIARGELPPWCCLVSPNMLNAKENRWVFKKDIKTQRRCYSNPYRQAIPQSMPPSQKKLCPLCVSASSKRLQVSFGHQILNFWKGCRATVVQRDKGGAKLCKDLYTNSRIRPEREWHGYSCNLSWEIWQQPFGPIEDEPPGT